MLDQKIQKSTQLIQKLDRMIDGLEVSSDVRARLAGGCLNLAMEYQKAIVLLIAKKIYGPAFAQVRLTFEAYVRGVWLQKCASQADLEKFQTDTLDKKYFELLKDVEKLPSHDEGVLSRAKDNNWKFLNGYTHCGIQQVVRQNSEDALEANYDENELTEAIDAANALGMLSAIAICDMAGAIELASEILDEAKRY